MEKYSGERNSHIIKGEVYFWTATIHDWQHLMADDVYKMVSHPGACLTIVVNLSPITI